MLNITEENNTVTIEVALPSGKSASELVETLAQELKEHETEFHGKLVKVTGRITTPMACYLGHALAHICAGVDMYVPQEGVFIPVIRH